MMMNQTILFIKMHGVGNDYIFVDTSLYPINHPGAVSFAWSRNHRLFWGPWDFPYLFANDR